MKTKKKGLSPQVQVQIQEIEQRNQLYLDTSRKKISDKLRKFKHPDQSDPSIVINIFLGDYHQSLTKIIIKDYKKTDSDLDISYIYQTGVEIGWVSLTFTKN